MKALDMGAVGTLICWENLDIIRYQFVKLPDAESAIVQYLRPDQEKSIEKHTDPDTGEELELDEKMSLLEWLANNFKDFGTKLEIITDKSQEGSQFCSGFGGIGGLLRYRVDFAAMDYDPGDFDDVDLEDYM